MVPIRHIEQTATDAFLLKDYQERLNQQSLATLYLRYTDLVYGTCMKYLKNEDASKDAVMDIYTQLLHKLATHKVEHFKSWLYVLTKNHCLMQLRKEKKSITVEFSNSVMQQEDFSHLDDVLEKEKELRKLENCIGGLNNEQQKVIRLFYLDSKCYNEIVDETGYDWSKVRSLVQNGRRNLKICMEK